MYGDVIWDMRFGTGELHSPEYRELKNLTSQFARPNKINF